MQRMTSLSIVAVLLGSAFDCHPSIAQTRDRQRKFESKEVSLEISLNLDWMRCEGEKLERALDRLRASPEWKELPPTSAGCRRFLKREAWSIDGENLYRQKPACSVDDPQPDARLASGCMEILVRRAQSIELPQLSIWNQRKCEPFEIKNNSEQSVPVTVYHGWGNKTSNVIAYSDSLAIRIKEASTIEKRLLTKKWIDELRQLLMTDSPTRLQRFDELKERKVKAGTARLMTLVKCPMLRGYYDAYGFVSVAEEGTLSVRVFDLDLKQYIDRGKYPETYEVVGCAKTLESMSYWNCYVKVPCQVGRENQRGRNVRIELRFRPARASAPEVTLAEIEIPNANCWTF